MKQRSFRHSGKLGDIVYSLPAVRALGGGAMYVNADNRYGLQSDQAAGVLRLLRSQPYITSADIWQNQIYDIDLDAFRCMNPGRTNLADCHLRALGLNEHERDCAWLSVGSESVTQNRPILVSRSMQRAGNDESWHELLHGLLDDATFVGTPQEHAGFERSIGPVDYCKTEDVLDLARAIAGCHIFIGSQSCPYAIAEGLKVPAVLVSDPEAPNCLFERDGLVSIRASEDVGRARDLVAAFRAAGHALKRASKFNSPRPQVKDDFTSANADPAFLDWLPDEARTILLFEPTLALASALRQLRSESEIWGILPSPASAAPFSGFINRVLIGRTEHMLPLPLPIRYFDGVGLGDILSSVGAPGELLTELRKHLAPGATVTLNANNASSHRLSEEQGSLQPCSKAKSLGRLLWESGYVTYDRTTRSDADPSAIIPPLRVEMLDLPDGRAEEIRAESSTVVVCRPAPDPLRDPARNALLLGPGVGELGPASTRCSIVIVTFNSESSLELCLNSVISSIGEHDEIIVVDNASEDGTVSLARRFSEINPRLRLILNPVNAGFSAGCNAAIRTSKGEYLALLNPDTEVGPGWVERLIAAFRDDSVGAVGPLCDNVSGDQFVRFHLLPAVNPESRSQLRSTVEAANQGKTVETRLLIGFCLMVKREVLNSVGLMDERMFLGSDDLELSWRLRTLGYKLLVATDTLVFHETGVSFASLGTAGDELRSESDRAFLRKLLDYYGGEANLDSRSIWGNEIFEGVLLDHRRATILKGRQV